MGLSPAGFYREILPPCLGPGPALPLEEEGTKMSETAQIPTSDFVSPCPQYLIFPVSSVSQRTDRSRDAAGWGRGRVGTDQEARVLSRLTVFSSQTPDTPASSVGADMFLGCPTAGFGCSGMLAWLMLVQAHPDIFSTLLNALHFSFLCPCI